MIEKTMLNALRLNVGFDTVLDTENEIEALWKLQKGINPDTGEAWLTPRMERNAEHLVAIWAEQDKVSNAKLTGAALLPRPS